MHDKPARPPAGRRPFKQAVPFQAMIVAAASTTLPLCGPGARARASLTATGRLPAYSSR